MGSQYPTLEQLLGGCFHQDWILEAESADEALATMVREAPADVIRAGLSELDALLARGLCEPQLRDVVLYEIGCDFEPQGEGLDTSAWLVKVREAFRRAVDASEP